MSVSINWALTDGGTPITNDLSHGAAAAGTILPAQTLFLSHNGTNNIKNCALYMAPKSTGYTGSASPTADFDELLGWGDQAASADFGGVEINMNALGSFPIGSWPTVSNKSPSNGWAIRTGVGDSSDNALPLVVATGALASGVIPPGNAPNVSMQVRVAIPATVGTTGTRQFDLRLKYTYTN